MSPCPICDNESDEGPCEHFVLWFDRTFPYASGDGPCPLSVASEQFDTESLNELDLAVQRVIVKVLAGAVPTTALEKLPGRLRSLVTSSSEGASVEDDELERDSYIGLAAYKEYLDDVIDSCPIDVESTYNEEGGPGTTSAYSEYWSTDVAAVVKHIARELRGDTEALNGLSRSGRG